MPYVLAATRLLAGEARLNGRPLWAKELDEAGSRLASARLTAVAFADELIEHPELLDAYGRAVSGADPLTLAIVGDDIAGLQSAVERAGLDVESTADLLAVGTDPPPARRRLLADGDVRGSARASTSRRSTSSARSRCVAPPEAPRVPRTRVARRSRQRP